MAIYLLSAKGLGELPNGNIVVSGQYTMKEVNCSTLETINQTETNTRYHKIYSDNSDGFYAISGNTGLMSKYNSNLNEISYKNIGVNASEGCIDTDNNKYYYINTNVYNKHSSVFIYDENNNLLNTIDLGSKLTSINYCNNFVYVTSSLENKLYIINAVNNQLTTTIDLPTSNYSKIFVSKNYTYIIASSNIIMMQGEQIIETFNVALSPNATTDFFFDVTNSTAYFLLTRQISTGEKSIIYTINEQENTIEDIYTMQTNGAHFMYVRPEANLFIRIFMQ